MAQVKNSESVPCQSFVLNFGKAFANFTKKSLITSKYGSYQETGLKSLESRDMYTSVFHIWKHLYPLQKLCKNLKILNVHSLSRSYK